MSLSKKERRRLAEEEIDARQRARASRSPLTREELDELYAFVAERAFRDGRDKSLALTTEWVTSHDRLPAIAFLNEFGVATDWDVLVNADPCALFGPTATRLARMPLEPDQLLALIDAIDAQVEAVGCQHDLRLTRAWLEERGLPTALVEFALIAQGGGCDCEVVLNVDPERIYPGE